MWKLAIFGAVGVVLVAACAGAYSAWQTRRIEARFPPAGNFVEVDGARLHFTDIRPQGQARGTLVLVHGASGNEAEMRAALGERLVGLGFRVISIDRPGHGWSDRHPDPARNDPAGQAVLIRKALENHGVSAAIPVVHSLAGALGMQLALDHADFARALVMIAPATHPWPGGIAAYYTLTASPVGPLFAFTAALPAGQLLMPSAVESVFAPQSPPPRYVARTGVELVLRPDTFRANALDVAGLYDFVSREAARYHRISVPVAIVSGSADTVVLTDIHSRNTAKAVPGADLTILDGVGHAPHWTHPDAVIAAIERVHARTVPASLQSSR